MKKLPKTGVPPMRINVYKGRVTLKADGRDPRQVATIKRIITSSNFNYAVLPANGDISCGSYRGPYTFVWYDHFDYVHAACISITGRIIKETRTRG